MKKIVTILAVAALVATSCSDKKETSATNGVDLADTNVAEIEVNSVDEIQVDASEMVDTDSAGMHHNSSDVDTLETSNSAYAEGSVDKAIDDFLASDQTGTKEFTLDALGGADGDGNELSEEAKSQLTHIAELLAANLTAEIQAHGPDKVGIKPKTTIKANWVKAKLVLFKKFKGEQLTAKGHGADHLIKDIDAKDDAQKRIVISLTK